MSDDIAVGAGAEMAGEDWLLIAALTSRDMLRLWNQHPPAEPIHPSRKSHWRLPVIRNDSSQLEQAMLATIAAAAIAAAMTATK